MSLTEAAPNWTATPHWVVMERERFADATCIGHWPTHALAAAQARRKRTSVAAEGTRVWVQRTC